MMVTAERQQVVRVVCAAKVAIKDVVHLLGHFHATLPATFQAEGVFDQAQVKPIEIEDVGGTRLAVSAFGILPPQKAIGRIARLLAGLEIHLPFDGA